MNQSKKLTEGAIYTAIYLVLLFVSFIPILSVIIGFILPIPFVIYTSRHGMKSGGLMLVATALLTSLIFTLIFLPITLLMSVAGILIGHGIHKKLSAYETWGFGTLGYIGGILFIFVLFQLLLDVNFLQELETTGRAQMETYIQMIEGIGLEQNADVDLETVMIEQMELLMNLVPALVAISAAFMAFVVQWLSYKIINRMDKKNHRFPPFRNLKLPASIIWLYLIVVIVSLVSTDTEGFLAVSFQNALLVLEILLAIQGFSFIFFFTHYKKMSKAIPVISIILTAMFPLILLSFVRILGIIDIGLNLRERMQKKK